MTIPSFARADARLLTAALFSIALATSAHAVPATPATETPTAESAALPGNSVYQLPSRSPTSRTEFPPRGATRPPLLISMFYTSCQFVCPMLIDSIRDAEKQLAPAEREQLGVLLVTFDPEHDTVAVLKRTADERGLDPVRWSLARTDPATVRKLASVLGIQYRALPNGDFNHTTAILLLDAQGRVVAKSSQLGRAEPAFVNRIRAVARSTP
jgi:protein SCO1/2